MYVLWLKPTLAHMTLFEFFASDVFVFVFPETFPPGSSESVTHISCVYYEGVVVQSCSSLRIVWCASLFYVCIPRQEYTTQIRECTSNCV